MNIIRFSIRVATTTPNGNCIEYSNDGSKVKTSDDIRAVVEEMIKIAFPEVRPHALLEQLIFANCQPVQKAAAAIEKKSEKRLKRPAIKSQPGIVQRLAEMKAAGSTAEEMSAAIGYPAGSIRSYFAWKAKREARSG